MPLRSSRTPGKRRSQRQAGPEGQMALAEHLWELRNRPITSAVATVVGMVGGFFLYIPFMAYITEPLQRLAAAEGSEASINRIRLRHTQHDAHRQRRPQIVVACGSSRIRR